MIENLFVASWSIISESSIWIIISLISGGLLHEFLPSSKIKKHLNRPGPAAYTGAVSFGAILPICSCGVIPLAVSLYRSGVRLGPVMAFASATPIINPAAVILSFALLGPQLSIAYIALGLLLPFLVGFMVERFGDKPLTDEVVDEQQATSSCCSTGQVHQDSLSIFNRVLRGLRWGAFDLGPSIGFYLIIGVMLGAILNTFVPDVWIQQYLNGQSFWGLFAAAVLGATIYVCAVAHIPLVASLIATGAGPGAAIVFLVTGTATNLPELFTLYKTIGKRTVIIYSSVLISTSLLAGWLVNLWLLPGFAIEFDPLKSLQLTEFSGYFWLTPSNFFNTLTTFAVILLATAGCYLKVKTLFKRDLKAGCCSTN